MRFLRFENFVDSFRYKRRVPASGLAAQVAENPEMSVHITQNPVVSSLVKKLNHMHQVIYLIIAFLVLFCFCLNGHNLY